MANISFQVAGKIDTIGGCIELLLGQNYTDTIYRNTTYSNSLAGTKIKIRNKCVTAFTIGAQNLFTDTTNGGNFTAAIAATTVSGGTSVDVDVRYSGTYKGTSNNPNYTITVNGTSRSYGLTILTPDTPPTATDVIINLANRTNTEVTKEDLSYNDIDGLNTVTGVRFTGDTTTLFTNSAMTTQYVSGTELNLSNFILYYKAPDRDLPSEIVLQYNVKANGVWSN